MGFSLPWNGCLVLHLSSSCQVGTLVKKKLFIGQNFPFMYPVLIVCLITDFRNIVPRQHLLENLSLVEAFLGVPRELTPSLHPDHGFRRNIHPAQKHFTNVQDILWSHLKRLLGTWTYTGWCCQTSSCNHPGFVSTGQWSLSHCRSELGNEYKCQAKYNLCDYPMELHACICWK